MRVLSVTPYYDPEGGGLERYAHEILRRLADDGHDVLALSSTRLPLGDEVRDGVVVRRRRPLFFMGNAPIDPAFARTTNRTIRSFDPDVVVAHTPVPFPAEMAYRAARHHGRPFVVTYHAGRLRGSSPPLDALARLDEWTLQRSMLGGSRSLIAVSGYVRDRALGRHRDRVQVVPPGVDTKRFTARGPLPGKNRILFVGPLSRAYRWKGADVLWRAFKRVVRRFPDAELTLVGSGDRRRRFIEKAHREGLRVRAPGRLGPDALVAEFQRSDVVVLPSTSEAESFGMVLAEANACSRPVVASRIGGIPDFVRHRENGLLFPPGDDVALADRITHLFLDPGEAQRMGDEGRLRVVREHDWTDLARRTMSVYETACADA